MHLRVFLSWSGERSRRLANELHLWLPKVIQAINPWMSEVDIPTGDSWRTRIGRSLSEHHVGLLCLTPENLKEPWLLFEAGALSKALDHARVCPVLLGLQPEDLMGGPLDQFQATRVERKEMYGLMESLNDLQGEERVKAPYLADAFEMYWPDLQVVAEELNALQLAPSPDSDLAEILRFVGGNVSLRRRQAELAENNRYLQAATSATIVAMTYKSLSSALPNLSFPKLQEVELCVYALPNLLFTHPVLQGKHTGLEVEWFMGLSRTIAEMLNEERCPVLTHLDLTVFSVSPTLTGTDVIWSERKKHGQRLRITFIVSGSRPQDIPTLTLSREGDSGYGGQVFEAFKTMIDKVGRTKPPSLRFALKRPNYARKDVDTFTQHLQLVCNHPRIGPQDRMFDVQVGLEADLHATGQLGRLAAARAIEKHRRRGHSPIQVTWEKTGNLLTLTQMEARSRIASIGFITEKHIFACFALMTYDDAVVLVDNKKGGWECDVPGGKVSQLDDSEEETLVREVFEELGFLLDTERLGEPLDFAYDHKSAREADQPVIAQYYHYPLDADEVFYLFNVAGKTTKENPLIKFPISRLKNAKRKNRGVIEAVCHAPLGAIERLAEKQGIPTNTK